MRGTRRRRAVKRTLHIFPNEFGVGLGTPGAKQELRQQRALCATKWLSLQICVLEKRERTGLEREHPTRSTWSINNYLIETRTFNNNKKNNNKKQQTKNNKQQTTSNKQTTTTQNKTKNKKTKNKKQAQEINRFRPGSGCSHGGVDRENY